MRRDIVNNSVYFFFKFFFFVLLRYNVSLVSRLVCRLTFLIGLIGLIDAGAGLSPLGSVSVGAHPVVGRPMSLWLATVLSL